MIWISYLGIFLGHRVLACPSPLLHRTSCLSHEFCCQVPFSWYCWCYVSTGHWLWAGLIEKLGSLSWSTKDETCNAKRPKSRFTVLQMHIWGVRKSEAGYPVSLCVICDERQTGESQISLWLLRKLLKVWGFKLRCKNTARTKKLEWNTSINTLKPGWSHSTRSSRIEKLGICGKVVFQITWWGGNAPFDWPINR